jgi:hypothetical protein
LVANFMGITYTVAVSAQPVGAGTVSGGETVAAGRTVTVTATANSGYRFTNWTEGGQEVSRSPRYEFTATTNRTLIANFGELAPRAKEEPPEKPSARTPPPQNGPAYQTAIGEAKAAEQAQDYSKAQEKYAEALRQEPDDRVALEGQNRAQKLSQLNQRLEIWEVWFGIVKPTDPRIKSPLARDEEPLKGVLTPESVNTRMSAVTNLMNEYRALGALTDSVRARCATVQKRIKYSQ